MRTKYRHIIIVLVSLYSTVIFSQVTYSPEFSLREIIRQQTWQELKPQTPSREQYLYSKIFQSDAYFKEYERLASAKGYNAYDLATITTFFKVICEEILEGKVHTDGELQTIFKFYQSNNRDINLTNEEKQLKYDALILKTMWIAQMSNSGKVDSKTAKELVNNLIESDKVRITGVKKDNRAVTDNQDKTTSSTKTNPKIYDIILRTVTSYGLNGVYITNKVSILFENGDVFTNPSKPLESFNINESKKDKPNNWDKWRKKGNIIQVTRSKNGKIVSWKKWHKVRPASNDFKLMGKFNSLDAFGGSTVINASTVYFDRQGRFAWKTVKGGNTVWKPIFAKSNSSGNYKIDDNTITLTYNNGVTESFFFGLYPKDNKHFIIGSNHFAPSKNN
ncbi:hypothetical protein [uncultured Croceitalea sp.]|uniref:hypothetical protein n=1 Tax=uncultured Croceitalea sp. TaxID=1798908 RepID=UPI003305D7FD